MLFTAPERGTAYGATQQIIVADDTVWWRAFGKVFFIAEGKVNNYDAPGSPGNVSAILLDKGEMWIAKNGGIYHRTAKWDSVKFAIAADQRAPDIYCICHDTSRTWIGTSNGLYKIVKGRITAVPLAATDTTATAPPAVYSITEDKAGALWAGTGSGAIKISGSITEFFGRRDGFTDRPVPAIFIDHENNVWLATDGQGIFRFSGTRFTRPEELAGLSDYHVTSFTTNRKDSMFFGTADAGLHVLNDSASGRIAFPISQTPFITSLWYGKNGRLWIGTRGKGLWWYADGIFRQFEAPERHFPSNNITCVSEDAEGRGWIGFQNGAVLFERDTFKAVPVNNAAVYSFLHLKGDSTLIATGKKNGLLLYTAGNLSPFQTNTAFDNASVKCLIRQGANLWAGSSDSGVLRYNTESHSVLIINRRNGLKSDNIENIVTDKEGNVFAGTPAAIYKITVDENKGPVVTTYGKAQGVSNVEGGINAVFKLPDGTLFYGTAGGVLEYDPAGAVASPAPVSIVLQSVRLMGDSSLTHYADSTNNWYGIPYHLRLPANKNNIAFTFRAISLSGIQLQYRYRLDGLDAPWSDWTAENVASYSALPPGKYVLRVQCRSEDEDNNLELSYPFEIITPMQQTAWFRSSILLLCVLAGAAAQYLLEQRRLSKQKTLTTVRAQEHNKIRLSTEEDFHGDIKNKLARIKLLTGTLRSKARLNPETEKLLGQIDENAEELYNSSEDILWSLDPAHGNAYEVVAHIRDIGTKIFSTGETAFSINEPDERLRRYTLPMDRRRSFIMIFKDALDNCHKHANAKNVWIEVMLRRHHVLQMILRDDGTGFDLHSVGNSLGIKSMQTRAASLGGRLYIDSRKDKGTIVTLTFKLTRK